MTSNIIFDDFGNLGDPPGYDEWDARDAEAYEWCDACGEPIAEGDGIGVDALPFSITWKDEGDSAVLCDTCYGELDLDDD